MIILRPPAIQTTTFDSPPTPSLADLHIPAKVLTTLLSRDAPLILNVSEFRNTTNIISSSLTTIFACTWVALHLDTPSTNKSTLISFWRRFRWMIVALIVPEFIAGEAIEELVAAKKYKDAWNANFVKLCSPELIIIPGKTTAVQYKRELKVKKHDAHWTLTHGFLAGMGGIRLYDSRDKPQKFKPKRKHFEDPQMLPVNQRIGCISKDDITDKSKGDAITKLFLVLQTTWFIVQCLARWAVHLPVTELEVVTVAYAVLNIVIYALLWHKPQSLCVPFRIFLDNDGEQVPKRVEAEGVSEEEVPIMGIGEEERMPILRPPPRSGIVDKESSALPRSGTCQGDRKLSHLPNELKWVESTQSRISRLFVFLEGFGTVVFLALSGSIFGALHLIPLWLSVFPSDIERKLWLACTCCVTAVPLGLAIAEEFLRPHISITLGDFGTGELIFTVFMFPYTVARIILLVLTFTTLRSLPTEAFLNVEWTQFIPHF